MIYHQKNRRKKQSFKILIIILVVFILFRIFNINLLSKIFDHPINYILESNSSVLSPFKSTLVYFESKKELEKEINQLKQENTNLKVETLFGQAITQEFEVYKSHFGSSTIQGVPAKVILRPPFTPFDTIKISGNLSSKQVGDMVFYKNILIGKIIDKDNTYATVELFSSPDKVTQITLGGTQFEAKGLGGGRYVFEASKELEVKEGEPVIYPDQSVLILGVVEFVESKEQDLFKKVYFNLPTPLNTLSYVTVGL